jgi:hypothetical protein
MVRVFGLSWEDSRTTPFDILRNTRTFGELRLV